MTDADLLDWANENHVAIIPIDEIGQLDKTTQIPLEFKASAWGVTGPPSETIREALESLHKELKEKINE